MRSNAGPWILVLSVLGIFGGLTWLTRHPEAPILERAETWPYVGPLASRFRQRFTLPPPPQEAETVVDARRELIHEPLLPPPGDGHVWILAGTPMYREMSETSEKIGELEHVAQVLKLDRRGDWFRVWRGGFEGWVYLEGYDESGGPPYGREGEPPKPVPSRPPDEAVLAAARSHLGAGVQVLSVGPYTLYTDVDDRDLVAHLDAVASRIEGSYEERYGLTPIGEPREVVLIYRREPDYRALQQSSAKLLGLTPSGHTTGGILAFYLGERPSWEVAATLVHEITHTLNLRALGPALPSWLDEGIADDLAASPIGPDGRLALGGVGGERRESGQQVHLKGAKASLYDLRTRIHDGRMVHVRDLLHLDWSSFVRRDSQLHYAASAFWVRYLLDGEGGRFVAPFRAYLLAVSEGKSAEPEALRALLDEDWSVLNAHFRLWLGSREDPMRQAKLTR